MTKLILSLSFAFFIASNVNAADVEFNTDLLDVKDKESIDSGVFKKVGYIVPGTYSMQVTVNNTVLGERRVTFNEVVEGESSLCLTDELVIELGLKKSELEKIMAAKDKLGCHPISTLEGMLAKGDLSHDTLQISVPQAYREYVNDYWDPPSRWEEGVNGVMLDYGLNFQQGRRAHTGEQNTSLSGYGVVGANMGKWRLRGDWQARYDKEKLSDYESSRAEAQLSRVYGYRALTEQSAKLSVGELDMGSSLFDGFRFAGASVVTDDNMLPPNLRGYAPEVVGIAKTNAKVVVKQQGRVIYETQVAAGPFQIQDLSSGITGVLDVRVEELDGSVQTFQVNTANIPYLSRPGAVRYKFHGGKVSTEPHKVDGPAFASGEFSWGVDNGWSLLGGALLGDGYSALSVGVGRDLLAFGALSFDVTESRAELEEGVKQGGSYRINYSKNFEEYDSQVAFAGYRFSERDFMTMNDFTSAKQYGQHFEGGSKEMYNIVLSKQFRDANVGAYLNYTHQSYWNQLDSERVSLSLSHYFDVMDWRGLTASMTGYRNIQGAQADNGMYFSLAVPFGTDKHLSYNTSAMGGGTSHSVSYFDRVDDRNSYSLMASTSTQGEGASGFYTHIGDKSTIMANASHQVGSNSSVGLSVTGGMTATAEGAALHRVGMMGGTRIMVDTDGVADVPLQAGGPSTRSDEYGKAVVADISSYYRQRTSIDVDQLSDEADPLGTPVTVGTLTEGAIGYRHFAILSGAKRMVELMQKNGRPLPFAAEVFNVKKQQLGMVADEGMGYLAGLHAGETIKVNWGEQQCETTLPKTLPKDSEVMRLTCH
ncbi:fimbria/pilus outer membrane usher protein [Aeromonas hydrophila]|uniref:fimbria/pilus outer membrane usher protein n=1 Tax=Aeromonas hydrophila TaxID=644 RepID=UPI001F600E6F|nr:fimbria/pilus outer membrane usher protein [Aeromonas hydrophila]UNU27983.1 fimbria/pilus outer membrane usher protein [Aeromonas hydrophila]